MRQIVFGMSDYETKKFTLDWYTACRNIRKAKKVPYFKNRKSSQGVNYSYKWSVKKLIKKFVFISVLFLVLLILAFLLYLLTLRPYMIVIIGVSGTVVIWWTIVFIMWYLRK